MKILVIEDHRPLAKSLSKGLKEENYTVDLALNGQEGHFLAESNSYDAIILDLMLPEVDGLTILKRWRQKGNQTPVLILTALDSPDQVVAGLDAGADDYLVKPFHFDELLARLRALIRREHQRKDPVLKISDLLIDTRKRKVWRGEKEIFLTAKEYSIIEYLAYHPGEVISRTELWDHLYDWASETTSNVIDVHIHHLRKKIDQSYSKKLIKTIKGGGYALKID
ncbi:MAG: response regulator transcription factor [Candidatus Saccharicenans sp.]|nr:MAG: DNA-binding response regulator [Candidatus Aminicenantes bacterium]HEK84756.1 response regulator transcription factor [Candidatus Aminicenantes bacterium]